MLTKNTDFKAEVSAFCAKWILSSLPSVITLLRISLRFTTQYYSEILKTFRSFLLNKIKDAIPSINS